MGPEQFREAEDLLLLLLLPLLLPSSLSSSSFPLIVQKSMACELPCCTHQPCSSQAALRQLTGISPASSWAVHRQQLLDRSPTVFFPVDRPAATKRFTSICTA